MGFNPRAPYAQGFTRPRDPQDPHVQGSTRPSDPHVQGTPRPRVRHSAIVWTVFMIYEPYLFQSTRYRPNDPHVQGSTCPSWSTRPRFHVSSWSTRPRVHMSKGRASTPHVQGSSLGVVHTRPTVHRELLSYKSWHPTNLAFDGCHVFVICGLRVFTANDSAFR